MKNSIKKYIWERKAMNQLKSLNNAALKDLGLDRSEIGSVIRGDHHSRRRSVRSPHL